jgi:hypothetical protein
MAAAAGVGALALFCAVHAPGLGTLVAAQLVAGAAWGAMLVAIFTSAADLGRTGHEGLALGTMFSMLALATLGRIGMAIAEWNKIPAYAPLIAFAPVALWLAGGIVSLLLARRSTSAGAAPSRSSERTA